MQELTEASFIGKEPRTPLKLRTFGYWFCVTTLVASPALWAQQTTSNTQTDPNQQVSSSSSTANGWPTADQQQSDQAAPDSSNQNPNQSTDSSNSDAAPQTQAQPQYPASQYPTAQYPQSQYPQTGNSGQQPSYQQGPYQQQPAWNQNGYGAQSAPPPVPAQLTIPQGSYVIARINQRLSSDHSQAGDTFTASLVEPLVVNGVVVAEPGETIGGAVTEAKKGGSNQRLVIQLTDLTLVDGQRVPLQTQLIARRGTGRNAQDAGTIVGTTAVGATIGAIAGGGPAAAIGAGAGLVLGALVTHDHPSVIYPEQILTFQLQQPITISTQQSAAAFRYIAPGEYDQPATASYGGNPPPRAYAGVYPYVGAYGYPGYYPYWGPSVGFYFGGGRYYRGPYYGGRYYGPRYGYSRYRR